jgi:hypothetical protein
LRNPIQQGRTDVLIVDEIRAQNGLVASAKKEMWLRAASFRLFPQKIVLKIICQTLWFGSKES